MTAPQTVIDYIIVHELCHILHRDQTDLFWNEVDKVIAARLPRAKRLAAAEGCGPGHLISGLPARHGIHSVSRLIQCACSVMRAPRNLLV